MDSSDPRIQRVARDFAVLQAKITKLTEENARLKQLVAEFKSANSRVRRIPKKTAQDPAPVIQTDLA